MNFPQPYSHPVKIWDISRGKIEWVWVRSWTSSSTEANYTGITYTFWAPKTNNGPPESHTPSLGFCMWEVEMLCRYSVWNTTGYSMAMSPWPEALTLLATRWPRCNQRGKGLSSLLATPLMAWRVVDTFSFETETVWLTAFEWGRNWTQSLLCELVISRI